MMIGLTGASRMIRSLPYCGTVDEAVDSLGAAPGNAAPEASAAFVAIVADSSAAAVPSEPAAWRLSGLVAATGVVGVAGLAGVTTGSDLPPRQPSSAASANAPTMDFPAPNRSMIRLPADWRPKRLPRKAVPSLYSIYSAAACASAGSGGKFLWRHAAHQE